MSRRPSIVSQADVARTIRAVKACGLTVLRVVTRADGVAIETTDLSEKTEGPVEPQGRPVL